MSPQDYRQLRTLHQHTIDLLEDALGHLDDACIDLRSRERLAALAVVRPLMLQVKQLRYGSLVANLRTLDGEFTEPYPSSQTTNPGN